MLISVPYRAEGGILLNYSVNSRYAPKQSGKQFFRECAPYRCAYGMAFPDRQKLPLRAGGRRLKILARKLWRGICYYLPGMALVMDSMAVSDSLRSASGGIVAQFLDGFIENYGRRFLYIVPYDTSEWTQYILAR